MSELNTIPTVFSLQNSAYPHLYVIQKDLTYPRDRILDISP